VSEIQNERLYRVLPSRRRSSMRSQALVLMSFGRQSCGMSHCAINEGDRNKRRNFACGITSTFDFFITIIVGLLGARGIDNPRVSLETRQRWNSLRLKVISFGIDAFQSSPNSRTMPRVAPTVTMETSGQLSRPLTVGRGLRV